MTDPTRRFLIRSAALALLLASPATLAAQSNDPAAPSGDGEATAAAEPATGDIVLGDPDAPLEVIEYASFTCPHCAAFHTDTWPEIRERYVETGKVRFILREVYFDQYGLWASMVARCGGERGFYPMADQFLKQQRRWTGADDIEAEIRKIGRLNGLTNDQLDSCLSDTGFRDELVANYQRNAEADGVRSTPSFVIGGELHRGNMSVEDFAALLDAELEG